jgi:RimJ/RimL family protein N-acetyltransferase
LFSVDELTHSRAPEVPTLLTERLRLREWGKSDVEVLGRLYDDPEVFRYFPTVRTSPVTIEDIQGHWLKHGFGPWAVAERKTGRFIGSISLAFPGHWPTPEISWVLDPRVWGVGLATEGARAIVDHAFMALGFSELMSVCLLGNKGSERVMQKLGMKATSFLATVNRDPLIRTYLLTREQWDIQARRSLIYS